MQGYVLHSYGEDRFLRHALACAQTIRRYDSDRAIALFADENHVRRLIEAGLDELFSPLEILPAEHRSIVGFKHHLNLFHPFERCLFIDSDMVWCRNPDPLWMMLSGYEFTATGVDRADFFFGGPKNAGVVGDYFRNRRAKTMKRFGVAYLPRVQAGMIYSRDRETCRDTCEEARRMRERQDETHFRSRLAEGRDLESCEWSLALALARGDLPVFPWRLGQNTPHMDFLPDFVRHDGDFRYVECKYFIDSRLHQIRQVNGRRIRDALIRSLSLLPGRNDHMWITPFALHFGWLRYKTVFDDFARRCWNRDYPLQTRCQKNAVSSA